MNIKVCTKCNEEKPATKEYFDAQKGGRFGLASACKVCRNDRARAWRRKNPDKARAATTKYRKANLDKFREYAKQDRLRNPEKFKERDRKYYLKNKQKKLNYQRQYRLDNPDAVRQAERKWREKNREYVSQKSKEWRIKNHERYRENIRRWQKENPDKKRGYYHTREAMKKDLPETLTVKQWHLCKGYFNHSCAYCGKHLKRLHQEHFVPVSKGGGYTANNIIPACKSCNSSKKDSDFFDWYPTRPFYSKLREKRILKYLNYDKSGRQQASILELVKEEA